MVDVVIYSSQFCGYCIRAKQLFDQKGVPYQEHQVDRDPEMRELMVRQSNRTSVPQIFVGGRHVGGYTDLLALERSGELDRLLVAQN